MPTDWESRYQTGDMPWEKGTPCPGLVDFLADHKMEGRVLVPGCGSGHDVRAISSSDNEVVGMDIAPSAIRLAESHPRLGCETYRLGDFFSLPSDCAGAFDWVWEHTCFCAIDPEMRAAYLNSVRTALNPGGHFLAIFYINPDHDETPPFPVSTVELDALFGRDFELIREWMPEHAYPGRERRELMRLLRKIQPRH